jgi:hypothetical protein
MQPGSISPKQRSPRADVSPRADEDPCDPGFLAELVPGDFRLVAGLEDATHAINDAGGGDLVIVPIAQYDESLRICVRGEGDYELQPDEPAP